MKPINNLSRRYHDMKARCYNKNSVNYKNYGNLGIKICDEWLGKEGKQNFIKWSLENGYLKELSIDRINRYGNYEPQNCRWTTKRIQNINKCHSKTKRPTTGYVGISIHSSSYGDHIYYYGRVRLANGKIKYTGMSKNIVEAVKMRNNYITENNLENEINKL